MIKFLQIVTVHEVGKNDPLIDIIIFAISLISPI